MKVKPYREYVFSSLARGGGHAVWRWIYNLLLGEIVVFENIGKQNNHVQSHYSLPEGIKRYNPLQSKMKEEDVITTFESKQFDFCCTHTASRVFDLPHQLIYVVLLRDPYNWMASCLKLNDNPDDSFQVNNLDAFRRIWLYQAETYKDQPGIVRINFNRWHENRYYRDAVALELGLNNAGDPRDDITWERGRGSSFENKDEVTVGRHLRVLERFKEYENDSRWKYVCEDPVIQSRARALDLID